MEIKNTKNYEAFDTITGNRVVNKKKVERLVEDVRSGLNLLPYCPIVVYNDSGNLKIVDGQHRYETSKKLKLPVYYVECEPLDLKKIARINSRSDKWKNKDFLECYIRLGVEDYQLLKDFMDKYQTIYSASIELLMDGTVRKNKHIMQIFRDGEFRVNHLETAEEIVSLTIDVFNRYKFRTDRLLIAAMQEVKKKGVCDFEILKQKIAQAPMLMNPQGSRKEYIYNIEQVYNHNNKNRVVIF